MRTLSAACRKPVGWTVQQFGREINCNSVCPFGIVQRPDSPAIIGRSPGLSFVSCCITVVNWLSADMGLDCHTLEGIELQCGLGLKRQMQFDIAECFVTHG